MTVIKTLTLSTLMLFLLACDDDGIPADPELRDYSALFSALPTKASYPADNPYNEYKDILGEFLFWDPILSGNQNIACASCHHPDLGWADGRPLSVGSDGLGLGSNRIGAQVTPFHSPTILNVAFTGLTLQSDPNEFVSGGYFWDLRADTLEKQALEPIKNPTEMLGFDISPQDIMNEIVLRLQAIPEYVVLFEAAFEEQDAINEENIAKAIANFERKIIGSNSLFDRFLNGDTEAFNENQIIGINKFIDGGCARCHSGPMLSDNTIHANEIVLGDEALRTPTMRNLSFTAPYMHDGSQASLIDAIAVYEERGDLQVTLDDSDFADIETFLLTLDADTFYREIPLYVPSGLTVGGDIH